VLVLSRRPGEAILIGPDIEIVILESDGNRVRVGIRAPRDLPVLRGELVEQVGAENRRAAAVPPDLLLAALQSVTLAGLGD
jgi:carbon storage regulator